MVAGRQESDLAANCTTKLGFRIFGARIDGERAADVKFEDWLPAHRQMEKRASLTSQENLAA